VGILYLVCLQICCLGFCEKFPSLNYPLFRTAFVHLSFSPTAWSSPAASEVLWAPAPVWSWLLGQLLKAPERLGRCAPPVPLCCPSDCLVPTPCFSSQAWKGERTISRQTLQIPNTVLVVLYSFAVTPLLKLLRPLQLP
uniref:Uncharacterized protein n=1 Tax=Calidris pygmaea TaxID=425635 RepID=A0A8C3JQV6_9CHAR